MSSNVHPVLTQLRFPRPILNYLFLFQSLKQFQDWAILVLVVVLMINGLIILADPQLLPLEGVLFGVALGALFPVFMVLPAEFEINRCPINLYGSLKTGLEDLGYIQLESNPKFVVYKQDLPRLLRWEEGNILIERSGANVIIKGPGIILWKLRRSLLTSPSFRKPNPL